MLLCLALPLLLDASGLHRCRQRPAPRTTRQAFDALATGFGPGFNGPLVIAAHVPEGRQAAVDKLDTAIRALPGCGLRQPRSQVIADRATRR